jgi:hypothetical protein
MTMLHRLRLRFYTGRQPRELQADILVAKADLVQRRVSERSAEYVALDDRLVDVLRERLWRQEALTFVRRARRAVRRVCRG